MNKTALALVILVVSILQPAPALANQHPNELDFNFSRTDCASVSLDVRMVHGYKLSGSRNEVIVLWERPSLNAQLMIHAVIPPTPTTHFYLIKNGVAVELTDDKSITEEDRKYFPKDLVDKFRNEQQSCLGGK